MEHRSDRFESPWMFALLAVGVVILGCLLWYLIGRSYPTLEQRASFGNIFGGINTLFAGLAFAALTYTLILQQRALALQRRQIGEQQQELANQAIREAQQTFESMLVQLLGFHHNIVNDVTANSLKVTFEGRRAIRHLADELKIQVANAGRTAGLPSIAVAQTGHEEFHGRFRGPLDHYFRNLYHIIKFIDTADLPDRRRYTSLVRAQLSPAELLILFYNGLSIHGTKFKPLIEEYALLEQLHERELPLPGHKALYAASAFG